MHEKFCFLDKFFNKKEKREGETWEQRRKTTKFECYNLEF